MRRRAVRVATVSAGDIVGIVIAVVVAFLAAGWQIKAARDRPRPHFTISGDHADDDGRLPVVLGNPGGAAVSCHGLAHVGKDFYEFRGSIVAQAQNSGGFMVRLEPIAPPTPARRACGIRLRILPL